MISGFTIIRNAFELDFCLELAVQSMLPVCGEVVVCDSDSTDGTREWLDAWAEAEPKLRVVNRPWDDPNGKITWIVDWMQWTQSHLTGEQHLYLDADEVLDPRGYDVLKNAKSDDCFWFERINYWRDAYHVAPHGTVCAHQVARFGPTYLPMFSDEIHDGVQFPLPEPEMRTRAKRHPSLIIHHLGFLRHRDAMFAKNAVNLRAFFGHEQDARLKEAAKHPERHWTDFCPFKRPLMPYSGSYPDIAVDWLKERGAL